jgi:hypothetical protein
MRVVILQVQLLPFFLLASVHCISQAPAEILGKWEGKYYIGEKIPEKSYGGVSSPHIYDSCRATLTIHRFEDSTFEATYHNYIISDPVGSFVMGHVKGVVRRNALHLMAGTITEQSLKKYSWYYWCSEPGIMNLKKEGKMLLLQGTFQSSRCLSAKSLLRKVEELTPESGQVSTNSYPAAKPSVSNKGENSSLTSQARVEGSHDKYKDGILSVQKTIEVDSDSLVIGFFDNGIIDGDTISVFFNGQRVASQIALRTQPLVIHLNLDPAFRDNEIAMFAENLGSISPNTAAMQLIAGNKTHIVMLTSTLSKTAVIRVVRSSHP